MNAAAPTALVAPGQEWEARWTTPAVAAMDAMPPTVALAAYVYVAGPLSADPDSYSVPLAGSLEGRRSAAVGGAYRVLVRPDQTTGALWVEAVNYRLPQR